MILSYTLIYTEICITATYMWRRVKGFHCRVNNRQIGKRLYQNTGGSLLNLKLFQRLRHLSNNNKKQF